MKTLLITALLTFTVFVSAQAQTQNKISIGIEGATLATGLINQNPYGFDKLPVTKTNGNSKAVSFAYQINSKLSLQSGVQLLNVGQNYVNLVDENHFNNRNIDLDYIQIPITIQNQLGEGSIKFIAGAGFSYSRLIASEFEENIDTTLGEGDVTMLRTLESDSKRFNKNQLSTNAYTGILLSISKKINVKATVLGNMGLTDINAKDYQYEQEWERPYKATKNISAGASIGLVFKL